MFADIHFTPLESTKDSPKNWRIGDLPPKEKKITFAHFLQKIKGTEALRPFSSGNGMVSLHLHFSRTTWVSRALKFQFVFPGKNQIFWKERLYIYIHIYERLLSFAGGRLPAPALRNGKMTLSKKNKKLKAEFFRSKVASPARSNSLEQNSSFGAIELKLFLCYSRFCRTAKQPALTSKMCTWHVQGTLSSHHHPTPPWSPYNDCHTGVASKMCTCARNVIIPSPPHPNPPHCDHRRTTTISGIYIYIYIYIWCSVAPPPPPPLWMGHGPPPPCGCGAVVWGSACFWC